MIRTLTSPGGPRSVLEAVQRRLDENPQTMRQRRETVEHPFGTIKARMGATHFLMKTLPRVASEMALHVLAYNLTRVMNIVGIKPLMAAIRGRCGRCHASFRGHHGAQNGPTTQQDCSRPKTAKMGAKRPRRGASTEPRTVAGLDRMFLHDQDPQRT
jgi:hypothetical protein